jgi:hypothetical protein
MKTVYIVLDVRDPHEVDGKNWYRVDRVFTCLGKAESYVDVGQAITVREVVGGDCKFCSLSKSRDTHQMLWLDRDENLRVIVNHNSSEKVEIKFCPFCGREL